MKIDGTHIVIGIGLIGIIILMCFSSANSTKRKVAFETTKQLQLTLQITQINHGITNIPEAIINQKWKTFLESSFVYINIGHIMKDHHQYEYMEIGGFV